jgi:hypothetical protein
MPASTASGAGLRDADSHPDQELSRDARMLFSLLYMVLRVIFRLAPFRGRAWDYPSMTESTPHPD